MNENQSMTNPSFPTTRPRRLRHHPLVREFVRETTLSPADLILPLFVRPGRGVRKEIASMPGNYQLSVDTLVEQVGAALDLGVRASSSSSASQSTRTPRECRHFKKRASSSRR